MPHAAPPPSRLQIDLPKPLGLKFARGNDGGAYVIENDAAKGNTDLRIQVRATPEPQLPPPPPPLLAPPSSTLSPSSLPPLPPPSPLLHAGWRQGR
jgi:hypothetical protein